MVAVPYPYVEREARKRRPALVVSASALAEQHGLLWVLMITSAANRPWARDVPITDLAAAGLPKPSVVRIVKIAAVEAKRREAIGRLAQEAAHLVAAGLRAIAVPIGNPG